MSVSLPSMVPEIMALARELGCPEEVLAPLELAAENLTDSLPLEKLACPQTAGNAWEEISARIPGFSEDDGMAQLAVTMGAAVLTRKKYADLGISQQVFLDTMLCIPRFLRETKDLLGRSAYDRGFWTWRQTGCLLFRLGTLEFEFRYLCDGEPLPRDLVPGDPVLDIHIPSDARISPDSLGDSYRRARAFFKGETQGPWCSHAPKAILCASWLLAETLQKLLPETSGIRIFAADYEIFSRCEDSDSFYRWLYQLPRPVPFRELPERTGLQRALKAHLLSGGHMGMAHGILKI